MCRSRMDALLMTKLIRFPLSLQRPLHVDAVSDDVMAGTATRSRLHPKLHLRLPVSFV